jgi:hypothetical protein
VSRIKGIKGETKMAALTYKKNTTEKFDVKGILDAEAKTVTYEEKEGGQVTINLQDYLDMFASLPVQITIQTKSEEELDLPDEEAVIGEDGDIIYE